MRDLQYEANADPDAVMAAVGRVIREWGAYGYTITGLDSPTWGAARVGVRHLDGSRFWVAVDRYGNPLGDGDFCYDREGGES